MMEPVEARYCPPGSRGRRVRGPIHMEYIQGVRREQRAGIQVRICRMVGLRAYW